MSNDFKINQVNLNSQQKIDVDRLIGFTGTENESALYEEWTSSGNVWSGPWGATTYPGEFTLTRIGNAILLSALQLETTAASTVATHISGSVLIPERFRPLDGAGPGAGIATPVKVAGTNGVPGNLWIVSGEIQIFSDTVFGTPFPITGSANGFNRINAIYYHF